MADIFISYKSEDRRRVQPLAEALEALGYTVWWDTELLAGDIWKRRIKAELDAASCVVVAWTSGSVEEGGMYASEWIEKEAGAGHQRGVLVPILLDADRIAWEHSQLQFADLSQWSGKTDDANFIRLVDAIAKLIEGNSFFSKLSSDANCNVHRYFDGQLTPGLRLDDIAICEMLPEREPRVLRVGRGRRFGPQGTRLSIRVLVLWRRTLPLTVKRSFAPRKRKHLGSLLMATRPT